MNIVSMYYGKKGCEREAEIEMETERGRKGDIEIEREGDREIERDWLKIFISVHFVWLYMCCAVYCFLCASSLTT